MKELNELYSRMGISPAVYAYGEDVIAKLRQRFDAIDQIAEYNQAKVLAAFRKNRVSATCFAASTGYGYNDEGRDKLEQVYADVFHTEAALVRPHITCGTHALTIALSANLLPGDELLSPVGLPYDTLLILGKPETGLIVTKPETLNDLATQIFQSVENED